MGRLDPALAAQLVAAGGIRRLRTGAAVFMEGEIADRIAVVLSGRLKSVAVATSGTEAVLAVSGPGELVGEISVFDGSARTATVTAVEPTEMVIVGRQEFERFLADNGAAALVLVRQLCDRLRASNETRVDLSGESVAVRVARRLLSLTADDGSEENGFELRVSQTDLGGWIGASREAVTRALGELRTDGIIRTGRRSIVIEDLAGLRARAR